MSEYKYKNKSHYTCPMNEGDEYRQRYLDSVCAFISTELEKSEKKRADFCSPEKMAAEREDFRRKYIKMIGQPTLEYPKDVPSVKEEFVGEDDFCKIWRLSLEVMPGFFSYGILMRPHGIERAPLVIAQHGGGGTPEKCSDMWGENNYGFFVKRILERGFSVFAPQIMVWDFKVPDEREEAPHGVPYGHRRDYDKQLKRLGLSLTGLEIFCIRREIDYLSTLDFVDSDRIGMTGLSYGGYFTLYTMAAEVRIRAGYSGAAFNDRAKECFLDWGYFDSASTFQDAEVAGLCAPRLLLVDVGREDVVFNYEHSIAEAERAKAYYKAADAENMLVYNLHGGGHRFDVNGKNFDRFFAELEK